MFKFYGIQCRNNLVYISESDKIKDDFKILWYNIKTYVLKMLLWITDIIS
jgi:hypothetical protein